MESKGTGKNGEIELLRLFLAIIIMLYHTKLFPLNNGWFATDIFFIISGFMLAKSAFGKSGCGFVEEICRHMKGRYCRFWKLILPIFAFNVITETIYSHLAMKEVFRRLFLSVPELLFIDRLGLNFPETFYVGASWFLSVIIISDIILYPLLLKYYNVMVHIVCPLIFVFGITFFYSVIGGIKYESVAWLPFLRGFIEMALGCFGYAMAMNTKGKFTELGKKLLTVYSVTVYIAFMGILFWDTSDIKYFITELLLMLSVIIIALGENSILPFANNRKIIGGGADREPVYITFVYY